MTCEDCVHHDLCFDNGTLFTNFTTTGRKAENVETNCPFKNFKNKADFVEVVRCKDCKHWKKYENTAGAGNCKKREFSFEYGNEHTFNPITMPDFNCSYGERSDT